MAEVRRGQEPPAAGKERLAPVQAPEALPLYFVGDLDPWLDYRAGLIRRCEEWYASAAAGRAALAAGEAELLFPPPAASPALAAASRWQPPVGPLRLVLVSVGGIYGGADGPAGLFQYLAAIADPGLAFLQLDAGHDGEVAAAVLRAGLRWLLAAHPEAAGRIVLAGFSMGSATCAQAGEELVDKVMGLLLVAGQTAGTQQLVSFCGKAALLVQGDRDPNVPPACCAELAKALGGGAGVRVAVVPQAEVPSGASALQRLQRHHLWDERWDVQSLVLAWLRHMAHGAA